jgi:hypothetical protein
VEGALAPTFSTLAYDVAETLGAARRRPSGRAVLAALARWERLFRSRHVLSEAEEIGVWGELWCILNAPDPDSSLKAWQGPDGERRDFFAGNISIEVKTSRERLRHHVSLDQVERPSGDAESFLVSIWVTLDPAGATLPSLVERVASSVADLASLEPKLLAVGYGHEDRALYDRRFSILERPIVFPTTAVPRIRSVDPGISEIRYRVRLDEDLAVSEDVSESLLRRLGQ